MCSAWIEHATGWQVDGVMGILLSLFILWNGLGLVKRSVSTLLGEGVKPDFRRDLTKYIRTFPQVLGCHDLIVPEQLQSVEETLRDRLEQALNQLRDPSGGRRCQLDITFDPETEE